jgi:hypothetical protein
LFGLDSTGVERLPIFVDVDGAQGEDRLGTGNSPTSVLLEQGQNPPAPASEGTRTQQVNVRLTSEGKLLLESTAKRKGFKGLSDFIRTAALESAR